MRSTLRALLEEEEGVVIIDLKDVLIVDREAIKLLAVCEANGVELRNCPGYIREWVTREIGGYEFLGEANKRSGGQRGCLMYLVQMTSSAVLRME